MNETLEEMARALFKSWFVDFEPVRAKMEGRWHRGESLPGLPAENYDLFPARLVPSELGEIPEGWEVKRLGDVASVVYGAPFASKRLQPIGNRIATHPHSRSSSAILACSLTATSQRATDQIWGHRRRNGR